MSNIREFMRASDSCRNFACWQVAFALALGSAGCDKLPSLDADKKASAPSAAPQGSSYSVIPTPFPDPPAQVVPAPRTPQQILDDFRSKEPRLLSDQDLQDVAALPEGPETFTELNLQGGRVTDAGLLSLPRFSRLESLNLSGTQISNAGLTAVAQLPELQRIALDGVAGIDEFGVAPLAGCLKLTDISLQSSIVADGVFNQLKDLRHLQVLRIGRCTNLLGMEFSKLVEQGAFPELRELEAGQSKFVFYGLRQLNGLKGLESLDASGPDMTDAQIPGFQNCVSLKRLQLADSRVSSDGLRMLVKLRQLEDLNLSSCPGVNDAAIVVLRTFKQLKRLSLDGTSCTEAGVRLLKEKSLPKTVIRFGGQDV